MIRWLKPGDTVPAGEPRRYIRGDGYVLLRWKVGVEEYVEVLEHRLVMGLPDGEIHHKDGDKSNNHPDNLEVTTKSDHAKHHALSSKRRSKAITEWGGMRSQYAYDKRSRRFAREQERAEFLARVAELRSDGLTTIAIGRIVGRDSSGISRILRGLQ